MAESLVDQINADVSGNKVMIYSKTTCPHCTATKNLLGSKGAAFKVVELNEVPNGAEIQAALATKTGQRTVPNIFINGQHIGGNSDIQDKASSGELDSMLA